MTNQQRDFRECVAMARWVGQLEENMIAIGTVDSVAYHQAEQELIRRIEEYEDGYNLRDEAEA